LLCCPDGEVVQDNITFGVGVILGFGNVSFCFPYKFDVPVCRNIRDSIVGFGLVFEIFNDLNTSHGGGKEKQVRGMI
jgi:hypothetical protein